jgi:phenylalanyl-tRNA synthetase beta chain
VAKNLNYNLKNGQLFHLARTYQKEEGTSLGEYSSSRAYAYDHSKDMPSFVPEEFRKRPYKETPRLAGVVFGNRVSKTWLTPKEEVWDVFDLISHVELLLGDLGLRVEFRPLPSHHSFYQALQPKRSVGVYLKDLDLIVGWIGNFHPRVSKNYGIDVECLGFELNLTEAFNAPKTTRFSTNTHVQRFQTITRDFSFVLSEDIVFKDIKKSFEQTIFLSGTVHNSRFFCS